MPEASKVNRKMSICSGEERIQGFDLGSSELSHFDPLETEVIPTS